MEQRLCSNNVASRSKRLGGPKHRGARHYDRHRVREPSRFSFVNADDAEVVKQRCRPKIIEVRWRQRQRSTHRNGEISNAIRVALTHQTPKLRGSREGLDRLLEASAGQGEELE